MGKRAMMQGRMAAMRSQGYNSNAMFLAQYRAAAVAWRGVFAALGSNYRAEGVDS